MKHLYNKTIYSLIIGLIFTILTACKLNGAVAVGICLHAYSPQAPDEKIECFEYYKFEKNAEGYLVYHPTKGAIKVVNYRFRKFIPYILDINATNPSFKKTLEMYETIYTNHPATRRYLQGIVSKMRKSNAEYEQYLAKVKSQPFVTLDNVKYLSPRFKGFKEKQLLITHSNGNAKIDINKLKIEQIEELKSIDKSFAHIEVSQIFNHLLINPKYIGVKSGNVIIQHENGELPIDLDKLNTDVTNEIIKINSKFTTNKVTVVMNKKLWNCNYDGLSAGILLFKHEKGIEQFDIDSISDNEMKKLKAQFPEICSISHAVLNNNRIWNAQYKGIYDSHVHITHEKGILKIPLNNIDDELRIAVLDIDPSFASNKSIIINNKKLWNAKLDNINNGIITLTHEEGQCSLNMNVLSAKDRSIINTIATYPVSFENPGFYAEKEHSYKIVLRNGRKLENAKIKSINSNNRTIEVLSDQGLQTLSFADTINLPGKTTEDRINILNSTLLQIHENLNTQEPLETKDIIENIIFDNEDIIIEDVTVEVLQVITDGLLARAIMGREIYGEEKYQKSNKVTTINPLDENSPISIDSKSEILTSPLSRSFNHGLSFIECNSSKYVDGQLITLRRIKVAGRTQYNDVLGTPRTVVKFKAL